MTEPNPGATTTPALAPLEAPREEPQVYRPLSMLAIAGLLLAGVYVALVVIIGAIGFFSATPMFLPGWTLLLPVAAAGLSLMGQWQIRESEGTRAGLALARWGLTLSIFAGLGYAAYQYFTGLAICQQANEFLMAEDDVDSGFFPRLQSGDPAQIDHAFLLTMPENVRAGIDPKRDKLKMNRAFNRGGAKEREGPLGMFRKHYLVRSLASGGKKVSVEPLGVESWVFDKGSYLVTRYYRLVTPEAALDILVPVQSTESDQRKWFLDFRKMDIKKLEPTPLGLALTKLSMTARAFVNRSGAEGELNDKTDKTDWEAVLAEPAWRPTRDHFVKLFAERGPQRRVQLQVPVTNSADSMPAWEVVNNRLRFTLDFQCRIFGPGDVPWMGGGLIVVEDQKPIELDAKNLPVPQSLSTEPNWKVVGIEFARLMNVEKMMPGMPK
jgi:hypothetical protein